MSWFTFAVLTMLLWGSADLFYKKSADGGKYSHLKTSIAVGLVMGAHAIFTLITGNIGYNFANIIRYFPVSLMYILSMTIGYFGLRYLELSVSSPVQNTSGAIVCILCAVFLKQSIPLAAGIAVAVICIAIFLLGILEKETPDPGDDKKYRIGIPAIIIPIAYCVIDALGTFFDAVYLDDCASSPLIGVTEETLEQVANVSYELTFLIVAVILSVYVFVIKHEKITSLSPSMFGGAVFETAGQFTYVYAMSGSAIAAAPMVACYSVVSMILSSVFLKERLKPLQYVCIFFITAGIIVLGIYDF